MLKVKLRKIEDFLGVIITAGIDAHLKQWNVSIYIGTIFHKSFQQEACAQTLYNYLKKNFPNGTYRSAYEAGYFGFVAHRELEELGICNKVLNAGDIPSSSKDKKRKNDRRDSKKIAQNLIGPSDQIPEIYTLSPAAEADRELVRYRSGAIRKEIVRCRQRLKAFLVMKGKHKEIADYNSSNWSNKKLKEIEELPFKYPMDKFMLLNHLENLREAKRKQSIINRQIVKLSKEGGYKERVKRLKTIPGVGILVAMTLITEIVDMRRFDTFDKLCSYCGIVPDLSASAETETKCGITNRANKNIRRMLVQACWTAVGRDHYFSAIYHKQLKRNGQLPQKAIIKVCNKMLCIIRAIWLSNKEYDINYNRTD